MMEEEVLEFEIKITNKQGGGVDISTQETLALSLNKLENDQIKEINLLVDILSHPKMKDGAYLLNNQLETVFLTLQERKLCSITSLGVWKEGNHDEEASIELIKLINQLIVRKFRLGSLSFDLFVTTSTKKALSYLFCGITVEHKDFLPLLEMNLSDHLASHPGLEYLARCLEVGWPVNYFSLASDFSTVEVNKWESLGKLIQGTNFKLSLYQTKTEINWDVKPLVEALSDCGELEVSSFPKVWDIVSCYFEPSSPRWTLPGPKPMKALLVTPYFESSAVMTKQGTCSVYLDVGKHGFDAEKEALQVLRKLVIENKLATVERMNLDLGEERSCTLVKQLFSSLAEQRHNLISVSATVSNERLTLPTTLRKQLENNLPKKMEDWTRSGTQVRYGRMKLMVIGNGQAGKSSTIRSLLGKAFDPNIKSTVVAAEKDVSISVKDVSFSRWQEMNTGSNWVADEMGDYFNKLQANVETVEDAVVWNREDTLPLNLKAVGTKNLKPIWLGENKKSKNVQNKEEIVPKKGKNLQKKAIAVFANMAKGFRGKRKQPSDANVDVAVDHNRLTIWDFGGQEVFYALHHLYLTTGGLYILVFDLLQMKNDTKSELDIVQFWVESTLLHAPESGFILVGTRCDDVTPEDLHVIHRRLQLLIIDKNLRFLESGEFCFYPIDNSNQDNIQSNLQPLKKQINHCFSYEEAKESFVWQKKVSLAWMYFMNHLVTNFNGMITSNQLFDVAKSMNLEKEKNIIPMLIFYKNAGAIIPFMKRDFNKGPVSPETSDYIVLSPEWLLTALGNFIYDPTLHKKLDLRYGLNKKENDLLIQYEYTGQIPKKVLLRILEEAKLSEIEMGFLLGICEEMLIMSTYQFKDGEEAQWLVPTMNTVLSTEYEISQEASHEHCHNVYIHWERYVPRGLYERVMCVMLSCNSGYDGETLTPSISRNFCVFHFRETKIFLVNESHNQDFRIAVSKDDDDTDSETFVLLLNLLEIVQMVVENLRLDVLGGELASDIQIEVAGARKDQKLRCSWDALRTSLQANKPNVHTFVSNATDTFTKVNKFKPFTETARLSLERELKMRTQQEESEHEEVDPLHLGQIIDANKLEFMRSLPDEQKEDSVSLQSLHWEWDCFLSHTWGPENVTHKKVLAIRNELETKEIRTWLDEFNLKHFISYDIVRGLRKSSCILVFITESYMEKVNNPDTHVAKEFKQAALKGTPFIIPVILDGACLKQETWLGYSVGYHLNDSKYCDLSSEETFDQNFEKLVRRIGEFKIKKRPPNSFDTPPVQRS